MNFNSPINIFRIYFVLYSSVHVTATAQLCCVVRDCSQLFAILLAVRRPQEKHIVTYAPIPCGSPELQQPPFVFLSKTNLEDSPSLVLVANILTTAALAVDEAAVVGRRPLLSPLRLSRTRRVRHRLPKFAELLHEPLALFLPCATTVHQARSLRSYVRMHVSLLSIASTSTTEQY